MIDPISEELISPRKAAEYYPRNLDDRPIDVSRVYRDMKVGHRGIRLESIRTPRLATSRQAVARFFAKLSEEAEATTPVRLGAADRRRESERVNRDLDRLGF